MVDSSLSHLPHRAHLAVGVGDVGEHRGEVGVGPLRLDLVLLAQILAAHERSVLHDQYVSHLL